MCNDNYHFYVVRHGRQRELFSASSVYIPYHIQVFCGRILNSVENYICFFLGGRGAWLITGYVSRVTRRMPPVDCLPLLSIWVYFRLFLGSTFLNLYCFVQCLVDHCLSFYLFFFWPLYLMSFFDLRIRLTRLVTSDFS